MSNAELHSRTEESVKDWARIKLTDPLEPERVHEVGQLLTLIPDGRFACGNSAFRQRDGVSITTPDGMQFEKKAGYRRELCVFLPDGETYRFVYCGVSWHRLIPQYTAPAHPVFGPVEELYGNRGYIVGTAIGISECVKALVGLVALIALWYAASAFWDAICRTIANP